jgi:hypothetical protein
MLLSIETLRNAATSANLHESVLEDLSPLHDH